jgi:hypothetical protein
MRATAVTACLAAAAIATLATLLTKQRGARKKAANAIAHVLPPATMGATLATFAMTAPASGATTIAAIRTAARIARPTGRRAKQAGPREKTTDASPHLLAQAVIALLARLATAGWPVASPHNAALDDISRCRRLQGGFGDGATFCRHGLHYQLARHAGGGQDYERFHVCSPNATNPDSTTAVHYLRLPPGACFSGFAGPTNIAGPVPLSESSLRPWFLLLSE